MFQVLVSTATGRGDLVVTGTVGVTANLVFVLSSIVFLFSAAERLRPEAGLDDNHRFLFLPKGYPGLLRRKNARCLVVRVARVVVTVMEVVPVATAAVPTVDGRMVLVISPAEVTGIRVVCPVVVSWVRGVVRGSTVGSTIGTEVTTSRRVGLVRTNVP